MARAFRIMAQICNDLGGMVFYCEAFKTVCVAETMS